MRFIKPVTPATFLFGAVLVGILGGAGAGAVAHAGAGLLAAAPVVDGTSAKKNAQQSLSPLALVKKSRLKIPGLIALPAPSAQPSVAGTVAGLSGSVPASSPSRATSPVTPAPSDRKAQPKLPAPKDDSAKKDLPGNPDHPPAKKGSDKASQLNRA